MNKLPSHLRYHLYWEAEKHLIAQKKEIFHKLHKELLLRTSLVCYQLNTYSPRDYCEPYTSFSDGTIWYHKVRRMSEWDPEADRLAFSWNISAFARYVEYGETLIFSVCIA